jgi:hypothetical protein
MFSRPARIRRGVPAALPAREMRDAGSVGDDARRALARARDIVRRPLAIRRRPLDALPHDDCSAASGIRRRVGRTGAVRRRLAHAASPWLVARRARGTIHGRRGRNVRAPGEDSDHHRDDAHRGFPLLRFCYCALLVGCEVADDSAGGAPASDSSQRCWPNGPTVRHLVEEDSAAHAQRRTAKTRYRMRIRYHSCLARSAFGQCATG